MISSNRKMRLKKSSIPVNVSVSSVPDGSISFSTTLEMKLAMMRAAMKPCTYLWL